jgi:CubicO group peptidase (beta-lactamase class C family)
MKVSRTAALAAFVVAVGTACETRQGRAAAAQPATPNAEGSQSKSVEAIVDSLVSAEALRRGVPGVAVVIVADGEVLVRRGYGIADVASGRAVTEHTPFNIASVTKPFTAAVVQMLAGEERIRLDAPASEYIQLPSVYRSITVRQLLTHTSGIARDLRRDNNDDPDAAEYRRRLGASQPSAPPGQRFEYSNTGFTVLGWLVEAVEGQPLEQVLRRRLFRPLGMQDARYRASLAEDGERARPHEVVDGQARPTLFISGGFGSGGMSLSAADFAAFGVGLQEGRVLPRTELEVAWSPGRLADDRPAAVRLNSDSDGYGFGWFITRLNGRRLVTHGGGITGFSANLYHFPDDRLTIAVISNTKGRDDGAAPVDPLARRITEAYLAWANRRPTSR